MSEATHILDELRRDGHVVGSDARLVSLSGGVSSEIYLVEDGNRQFVVKRALPKLKVRDDWYADINRNVTEQNYLTFVSAILPGAVPLLYFSDPNHGYFGMEYMGNGFSNWKSLLLAGDLQTKHAELAGSILGAIHRRTAHDDTLQRRFDTTATFHQLRVEPYLLTTGKRHPELCAIFVAEAQRIEATREALVHGDFSPKNILFRGDRIVLLDCEVAWYGDPTFDVAFLLSHLFLKSLYHASRSAELQRIIRSFWRTYEQQVTLVSATRLEARLVPLLMMLLLARVDGKSPVEYLSPPRQSFIRAFIRECLPEPPMRLSGFCTIWFSRLDLLKSVEASA